METRRIGALEVSVVGLGCNNFGGRLDAAATAAVVARGARRRHQLLRHRRHLRRHAERGVPRPGARGPARRGGARHQVRHEGRRAAPGRAARLRAPARSRTACAACGPTASTSTSSTSPTRRCRSRTRSARWTSWCGPARCARSAAPTSRPSSSARPQAAVPDGAARFVSVQNEYSLLQREPGGARCCAECERQGLAFLPYFPLASGLLTGKYRRGQAAARGRPDRARRPLRRPARGRATSTWSRRSIAFAEARGHTLLELAFSWLLARPPVASVIAGATSPEQVAANAEAAGWRLTPAELAEIDAIVPR